MGIEGIEMLYGVSANRMTLTRTRKRLGMARRGHTLMKHKLEELMRLFQDEVDHVLRMREDVATGLQEVYTLFLLGQSRLRYDSAAGVRCFPLLHTHLTVSSEHVLNLTMPVFSATVEVEQPPYGLLDTTADLDGSVQRLQAVLPLLLRLAQGQRRIELLKKEIETTHRRVNALEYVLIPQLEEQAQRIQMKLDEMDRANISRLMRIKSIIRKESV
jgi:V/A-type H+-transporting ATPase subunit D